MLEISNYEHFVRYNENNVRNAPKYCLNVLVFVFVIANEKFNKTFKVSNNVYKFEQNVHNFEQNVHNFKQSYNFFEQNFRYFELF